MSAVVAPAAYLWGRMMAAYSLRAARPVRARVVGTENLPPSPVIFIGWHTANLLELSLMIRLSPRRYCSFVPNGIVGAAMRGMLDTVDVEVVDLEEENSGGVRSALRQMIGALDSGLDVIVAGDGPGGPAAKLRPGAIWLAKASGRPVVSVGCAVRPAIRVPRWDRLLVPMPGAQICAVFDDPQFIARRQSIDETLVGHIEHRLNFATDRAWQLSTGSESMLLAPNEIEGDR